MAVPSSTEDLDLDVDVEELKRKAEINMMKEACTTYDTQKKRFVFSSVWESTPEDLGKYGIGIQLYFQLLKGMAVVFFIATILSLPSLSLNIVGTMAKSTSSLNKFLGSLSVGNLGSCPPKGCNSVQDLQQRCLLYFQDICRMPLSNATPIIGIIDAVVTIIFIFFAEGFFRCFIPQVKETHKESQVQVSDYAIEVSCLAPRLKSGHEDYARKLKDHFMKALKPAGRRRDWKRPINDPDAIEEVVLVRNYDGCISNFINKGHLMQELHIAKVRSHQAKLSGRAKAQASMEKIAENKQKRIQAVEKRMVTQAMMRDEDREVCSAFIIFRYERYRQLILYHYRFSEYFFTRFWQGKDLRFAGHKIRVSSAPEPNDLYWENLDFSSLQRFVRQVIVILAAFAILVGTSLVLVYFSSLGVVHSEPVQTATWVLKSTTRSGVSCMHLCNWQLFQSLQCTDDGRDSMAWTTTALFDPSHKYPLVNNKSQWSASCSSQWTSPACSSGSGGVGSIDWIGITFQSPQTVNCMKVLQPAGLVAQELQLLGCESPPDLNQANWSSIWKPEEECQATLAVSPSGADSGPMGIAADTFCTVPISLTAATAARNYALTLPVRIKGSTQTVQATLKTVISVPAVSCFCQQAFNRVGYQFLVPPYSSPEAQFCREWIEAQNSQLGFLAAGIITVCVLNSLLLVLYLYMVQWERPISFSDETFRQLWKLFIGQFFNTGILVLVINFSILNYPASLAWLQVLAVGRGDYDDFNTAWYVAVGSSIILQIAIQLVTNVLSPLVWPLIVRPLSLRFQHRYVTQEAMNELYAMPQWSLSLRLAQSLNVIFVCIMYAAGMPAMYLLGFLFCVLTYWVDKWSLLKTCARPPAYSEDSIKFALNVFPIALLLHLLLACWTFGKQSLFPSDWSPLQSTARAIFHMSQDDYDNIMLTYPSATLQEQGQLQEQFLRARLVDFGRKGCWLLFVVLIVYILLTGWWYAYSLVLEPFFRPLIFILKNLCKKEEEEETKSKTFKQAKGQIRSSTHLTSYKLGQNPKYAKAYVALQDTHMKIEQEQTLRSQASEARADLMDSTQTMLALQALPSAAGERSVHQRVATDSSPTLPAARGMPTDVSYGDAPSTVVTGVLLPQEPGFDLEIGGESGPVGPPRQPPRMPEGGRQLPTPGGLHMAESGAASS